MGCKRLPAAVNIAGRGSNLQLRRWYTGHLSALAFRKGAVLLALFVQRTGTISPVVQSGAALGLHSVCVWRSICGCVLFPRARIAGCARPHSARELRRLCIVSASLQRRSVWGFSFSRSPECSSSLVFAPGVVFSSPLFPAMLEVHLFRCLCDMQFRRTPGFESRWQSRNGAPVPFVSGQMFPPRSRTTFVRHDNHHCLHGQSPSTVAAVLNRPRTPE